MDNAIKLTLEFDITQGKQGWNNFLNYGKEVKQQLSDLVVSPTKFMGMDQIGKEAIASGTGVDELIKKVQQLETQLEKLKTKSAPGAGLPQFKQLTGDSRMAVNAFNYTLQDSGMFFVNFRMGMMSISNNIPMLIQGLIGMKREAAEGNKSFKTYLKESFSGPNAFLPVISLVSVAMIALPAIFDKIKEAAKASAEEGIKKLTKELEGLSNIDLANGLNQRRQEIVNFANSILKMRSILGPLASWFSDDDVRLEAKIKELQLLTDEKGKREELNKTILGRLDLEKKDLEYQKSKVLIGDDKGLLAINNKLFDVNERIRKANLSSNDVEKEKTVHLDKQLKTLKEIYAIKKLDGPDLSGAEARMRQEQELQKLEIGNIQDKEEREVKLSMYQYKLEVERIRKEVQDKELQFKLISELYTKHLHDLDEIRNSFKSESKQSEADQNEEEAKDQFNFYKIMYESAADVLRSVTVDAWQDIFGEANSLAEKFGQTLLQIFLDEALRAAAAELFSGGSSGKGGRGFDLLGTLVSAGIGFLTGGPGGAAVGAGSALAGGSNRSSYNNSGSNYQTDMLNYAMLPNQAEVRTVLIQPDMSGVRDEIRSWAKEVDLKWDYNQFKAGLTAHEHRQSFEE